MSEWTITMETGAIVIPTLFAFYGGYYLGGLLYAIILGVSAYLISKFLLKRRKRNGYKSNI